MEAIQRMRRRARDYGYLRSNQQVLVSGGSYITIIPANPDYVCVPVYDPRVVYYAPRPGFYVGGAIGFGFGISLGYAFRPYGWGASRFAWDRHEVYVGNARWDRNWGNRGYYAHPAYRSVPRWGGGVAGGHPVEQHARIARSEEERNASRRGNARPVERHEAHNDSHGHDRH